MKHHEWVKLEIKQRRKSAYNSKDENLRWLYGLTYEDYLRKYEEQQGRCAICNNKESSRSRNKKDIKALSVDHCHLTGKVRDLLCHRCNAGIGYFLEDISSLASAITYLQKHAGTDNA